jgi:hypothetical protein
VKTQNSAAGMKYIQFNMPKKKKKKVFSNLGVQQQAKMYVLWEMK